MSNEVALFLDVFEPVAITYALGAGLAFGSTVLLYYSLKYPPKIALSGTTLMIVAVGATMLAGVFFFAGQVVQAYTTGDPFWPRALARAALWMIFSIGLGVGLSVARSFAHRPDGSREVKGDS